MLNVSNVVSCFNLSRMCGFFSKKNWFRLLIDIHFVSFINRRIEQILLTTLTAVCRYLRSRKSLLLWPTTCYVGVLTHLQEVHGPLWSWEELLQIVSHWPPLYRPLYMYAIQTSAAEL
jgi:hypothetical protein